VSGRGLDPAVMGHLKENEVCRLSCSCVRLTGSGLGLQLIVVSKGHDPPFRIERERNILRRGFYGCWYLCRHE
jgi:hypothetical protein